MATITIKNLIGGSINIITGSAERWVPACNPDGSPLTDTDHAEWVFSDGGGYNLKYVVNEEGGWDAWCGDQGNGAYMTFGQTMGQPGATFINLDGFAPSVSAYRKYTPGHWEDADGNWINGSWGDWNSVISGYQVKDGEPYGNPEVWYLISDGQPSAELQKSSNLALWYGDFSGKSNIPFATRTWTNTTPAPTT